MNNYCVWALLRQWSYRAGKGDSEVPTPLDLSVEGASNKQKSTICKNQADRSRKKRAIFGQAGQGGLL